MLLLCAMTLAAAPAQKNFPVNVRMEVAEAETTNGDYSIFTYKDSADDDSFGYYLSLGRTAALLGADEILGMVVQNVHEVAIRLGGTTSEALAAIDNIISLFDGDTGTTSQMVGRATTDGQRLGEQIEVTCTVEKKPLFGKRLRFQFAEGKKQAHVFLTKPMLRTLRSNMKIDMKLNPKHHRKQ